MQEEEGRLTVRVTQLSLTSGAQHGADNGQLEAKLKVLHSGGNLKGVIMKWVVKAAGHNLNEGCALAHEHVVDETRPMTSNLQYQEPSSDTFSQTFAMSIAM